MPSQPLTTFDVRDGVATLVLDDARRMNPLTEPLLAGCLEALARVQADRSVRALVVKANGKGFCSGADLVDIDPAVAAPGVGERVNALLRDFGHRWIEGLQSLEVPVLALVHGPVAGGGVGFALAADFVVAARSSYFYLPFVPALGLVPDMGATWLMQRAIGGSRMMALSLLGDRLGAEEAACIGLIHRCVEDAELEAEGQALAARLAALPSHGMKEMRALAHEARRSPLPDFLAYERERQAELLEGPSFAEGVAAFKARRPPVFPPGR